MGTIDIPIEDASPSIPSAQGRFGGLRYFTWWMPVFVILWAIVFWNMFPDPLSLLKQNWPLFIVGLVGATIGNATAVGGGIIFIPVMIFVYQLPAVTSLKVALASQSFGMTSGAIGWASRGIVKPKILQVATVSLLIGSTISSLVIKPNALLIKGFFGPASVFIGVVTLLTLNRHGSHNDLPSKGAYFWLAIMAFIGGLLTGWVAIGEGEVIAAFLMLVYGLRAERGIGLGVILLAINSIYLTLIHQFFLGGIPWELAMFTGFGCVFGGRLGPYLSQWVGPRRLKIGFATIAIIDGIIFSLQFLLTGAK
jgi:uncharacterized membrane protein YfcA